MASSRKRVSILSDMLEPKLATRYLTLHPDSSISVSATGNVAHGSHTENANSDSRTSTSELIATTQLETDEIDAASLALLKFDSIARIETTFSTDSKHDLHSLPSEQLLCILIIDSFELLSGWIIIYEVVKLRSSSSSELVRSIRPVRAKEDLVRGSEVEESMELRSERYVSGKSLRRMFATTELTCWLRQLHPSRSDGNRFAYTAFDR
jgi:hypothetical protein